MLYGKYDFHCELKTESILPAYKGSTFRGVFGLALKNVVCALKQQDCNDCILKKRCVYARIFETGEPLILANGKTIHSPPRPFVIEPPLTRQEHFPAGSHFDFSLLLFGEANHNLPYFVYAFEQMGKMGIGKRVNGKRGLFSLKQVSSQNKIIFSDADKQLDMEDAFTDIIVGSPETTSPPDDLFRIKITLETPLRFKYKNRLASQLPFHLFAQIMLRRINLLFYCCDTRLPEINYSELLDRSKNVEIVEDRLRWFDWTRYSGRQEKSMMMGGMVGDIVYEGKLGEFLSVIEFCEKVHLGKQAAFGLGKFGVQKL
jgi:hypothetical protein